MPRFTLGITGLLVLALLVIGAILEIDWLMIPFMVYFALLFAVAFIWQAFTDTRSNDRSTFFGRHRYLMAASRIFMMGYLIWALFHFVHHLQHL